MKLYSCELKNRNEIECYDKVMELYPNYFTYFTIWFILGLGYKIKAKEYFHRSKLSNKTMREIKWKMLFQIYSYTLYIIYNWVELKTIKHYWIKITSHISHVFLCWLGANHRLGYGEIDQLLYWMISVSIEKLLVIEVSNSHSLLQSKQ